MSPVAGGESEVHGPRAHGGTVVGHFGTLCMITMHNPTPPERFLPVPPPGGRTSPPTSLRKVLNDVRPSLHAAAAGAAGRNSIATNPAPPNSSNVGGEGPRSRMRARRGFDDGGDKKRSLLQEMKAVAAHRRGSSVSTASGLSRPASVHSRLSSAGGASSANESVANQEELTEAMDVFWARVRANVLEDFDSSDWATLDKEIHRLASNRNQSVVQTLMDGDIDTVDPVGGIMNAVERSEAAYAAAGRSDRRGQQYQQHYGGDDASRSGRSGSSLGRSDTSKHSQEAEADDAEHNSILNFSLGEMMCIVEEDKVGSRIASMTRHAEALADAIGVVPAPRVLDPRRGDGASDGDADDVSVPGASEDGRRPPSSAGYDAYGNKNKLGNDTRSGYGTAEDAFDVVKLLERRYGLSYDEIVKQSGIIKGPSFTIPSRSPQTVVQRPTLGDVPDPLLSDLSMSDLKKHDGQEPRDAGEGSKTDLFITEVVDDGSVSAGQKKTFTKPPVADSIATRAIEMKGVELRFSNAKDIFFSGFNEGVFTPLPGALEPAVLVDFAVTSVVRSKEVRALVTKYAAAAESLGFIQDSFWWVFSGYFKPSPEDQSLLFNRMAFGFVGVFMSVRDHNAREKFMAHYVNVVCISIYGAMIMSLGKLTFEESKELMRAVFESMWEIMTGAVPGIQSWEKWSLDQKLDRYFLQDGSVSAPVASSTANAAATTGGGGGTGTPISTDTARAGGLSMAAGSSQTLAPVGGSGGVGGPPSSAASDMTQFSSAGRSLASVVASAVAAGSISSSKPSHRRSAGRGWHALSKKRLMKAFKSVEDSMVLPVTQVKSSEILRRSMAKKKTAGSRTKGKWHGSESGQGRPLQSVSLTKAQLGSLFCSRGAGLE